MLRFEGFSSCCGVYSRVDLRPDAFDVDLRGKGTTNVDFNERMRTALRRLPIGTTPRFKSAAAAWLSSKDREKIIERKVKLPVRWIKGFCEVQAYQPRLTPRYELTPLEARDLFRSLPKANSRIGCFVAEDRPRLSHDADAETGRRARRRGRPRPRVGAAVCFRQNGPDLVRRRSPDQRLGNRKRSRTLLFARQPRTQPRFFGGRPGSRTAGGG